jgi:FAD/FMN-containing dehydrogenase/Fe-S oxidoreductase
MKEDLAGLVRGELRFDDVSRTLYSTDASLFQVMPAGVVVPRDEQDVHAVVRYAREQGISLIGRGAGSGMAGESLGPGLVIDFTKHFRQIVAVNADTVRVQVGVVYRSLQEALATVGRRFAPDPASGTQCTIGGMLANNASGARALQHGYTRDHVRAIRAVLDDGSIEDLGLESCVVPDENRTRKQAIVAGLLPLLTDNAELIRACQPGTRFNRCGYLLNDVLGPDVIDLARLTIGSEGTLALFTEATLRIVPLPLERSVGILGFRTLEAAARAVPGCLPARPAACELLDRRLLSLTCEAQPEYQRILGPGVEAVLLYEIEADQPGEAGARGGELGRRLQREPGFLHHHQAADEAECAWLWRLRDLALPLLHRMPGRDQPIPLIEDVGVPVEHLATYLHRVQEVLQKHQTTASFLIHAGAGQVHTRPFLDLRDPSQRDRARALAAEVHDLALDLGGTISTQHGVGLARTPWVARQYGRLFQVLRQVKAIFDPEHLFNPGKIVEGEQDPLDTHLRKDLSEPSSLPTWRLRWSSDSVTGQCHQCNGCGACRTEAPAQRMCPLFRATGDESATPRAKANLLRTLLAGQAEQLTSDAVREVADLCINCKMCAMECPARVNIPKLMLEAKAQHAAEQGLGLTRWLLARSEALAVLGSALAPLVNPLLAYAPVRWLMEKTVGIARQRRLPPFAARSFLARAERFGLTRKPRRSGPTVVYFVDVFANYHDPALAEAVVRVLEHNGVEVYVPPQQLGCGMAPLAQGDVSSAQRVARMNLQVLADLARAGHTIVCSEPTAAVMLRQDYRDLVDDPDTDLVARQTTELTTFLWRLHEQRRLRTEFKPLPLTLGHHVPCHVKALGLGVHGAKLLSLIPDLRVLTIDKSCSGMAGTYGLLAENFAASLAAGGPMLDAFGSEAIHAGSSECSPCRMQMEQGGGKRSLHPVQYLALAYGLMPEIAVELRGTER